MGSSYALVRGPLHESRGEDLRPRAFGQKSHLKVSQHIVSARRAEPDICGLHVCKQRAQLLGPHYAGRDRSLDSAQ